MAKRFAADLHGAELQPKETSTTEALRKAKSNKSKPQHRGHRELRRTRRAEEKTGMRGKNSSRHGKGIRRRFTQIDADRGLSKKDYFETMKVSRYHTLE
jgi:hypothetical protein